MEMKTYVDDDLQMTEYREGTNPWEFIADIPGDNSDLLGDLDNHELEERLKAFGAIGDGVESDNEECCSYYYFKDKATGRTFITYLNQYLLKKAELVEAARKL